MKNSTRCEVVTSNVTPEMKDALNEEAKRDGVSVSLFIFDVLKNELSERGCDLSRKPMAGEQPLPLEQES